MSCSTVEPSSDRIRKVRILIADDYDAIRTVVRSTIKSNPDFEVCGEARDGVEAIEEARRLKPDVVVLNISMPKLSGFAAARKIRQELPEAAIVILSSNIDKRFVEEASKIGAKAYVSKTKATESLVKAIGEALEGREFVVVE